MIVMVAISTSLILTLAFLRTQSTVLRIRENGSRRELALQAAHTGAAVALERMQSPDWQGVDVSLSRTVDSGVDGTATYTVEFGPLTAAGGQPLPDDAALVVVIRSTGTWQSNENTNEQVQRTVEATVRLRPRLEGRTISPGDSPTAADLAPNPADYDLIQTFAMFSRGGTDSLVLGPAGRIDGKLWLYDNLRIYKDPHWSGGVRTLMLESIGSRFVTNTGTVAIRHPHPLAGEITFYQHPGPGERHALEDLAVPWRETLYRQVYTRPQFADWQTYHLYAGGFEYSAVPIETSILSNTTLRPTPENPLGIFYRSGTLRIEDNVTMQGTLVVTGKVTIAGDFVQIAGFNWRGEDGTEIVSNVQNWPRLPAVVAYEVGIERDVKLLIDGAVVVQTSLNGAGGDFEYVAATDVDLVGKATARPLRQPLSIVELQGTTDLSLLNGNSEYAVWLADGTTGGWHAIVSVNKLQRRLTVVGEVEHLTATDFRIRRNRKRYVDLRGPVSGEQHDINQPPAWAIPSSSDWDNFQRNWNAVNKNRHDSGLEPIEFVDWLANAANFSEWPYPLSDYGLQLEPTFHLRNTAGIRYRWSPPLFQPYPGDGSEAETEFAGYRWKLVSWRELP